MAKWSKSVSSGLSDLSVLSDLSGLSWRSGLIGLSGISWLSEDQIGFIKGRYIGENILKITNLMDYVDENNIPALLLSADFPKAFDSLEWDFIDCYLQLFNFGPSLRKWAKIFDTNITTLTMDG